MISITAPHWSLFSTKQNVPLLLNLFLQDYPILSFNLPGITCLQVLSPIFWWVFFCSLWGADIFSFDIGLKHSSKCCLCLERSVNLEQYHYPVIFQRLITPSLAGPNIGPFSDSQHCLKLQPICYNFFIWSRDHSKKWFSYFEIFVTYFLIRLQVLPPLDATRSSSISFKIRTNEPNGLLMYSSGASSSHVSCFCL